MITDELKKEAEEWLCNNLHSANEEDFIKAMVDIAEPRENRIAELINLIHAERKRQEQCDDIHLKKIAELEKENAELEERVQKQSDELYNRYAETKFYKENWKNAKQENAELKELLEACKQERTEALYRNDQYIKENAELKKQLEMSNKVYNDNCDYSHHIEGQLTKAKDHIKKLLDCLKQDTNDPQTNYYVCQYMDKAEQFLSEVEK